MTKVCYLKLKNSNIWTNSVSESIQVPDMKKIDSRNHSYGTYISAGLYAAVMQHFCLMTVFLAVMVAVVVMEVLASVTFFALNNDPSVHSNTNAMLKKTLQR